MDSVRSARTCAGGRSRRSTVFDAKTINLAALAEGSSRDTVIGLLKVNEILHDLERAAAAATLDNWSAEFGADVVPSNERVQQIIDNEACPPWRTSPSTTRRPTSSSRAPSAPDAPMRWRERAASVVCACGANGCR